MSSLIRYTENNKFKGFIKDIIESKTNKMIQKNVSDMENFTQAYREAINIANQENDKIKDLSKLADIICDINISSCLVKKFIEENNLPENFLEKEFPKLELMFKDNVSQNEEEGEEGEKEGEEGEGEEDEDEIDDSSREFAAKMFRNIEKSLNKPKKNPAEITAEMMNNIREKEVESRYQRIFGKKSNDSSYQQEQEQEQEQVNEYVEPVYNVKPVLNVQPTIYMTEEEARVFLSDNYGYEIPSNVTPFSYATNYDYSYLYIIKRVRDILDSNNIIICKPGSKFHPEKLNDTYLSRRKKMIESDNMRIYASSINSLSKRKTKSSPKMYFHQYKTNQEVDNCVKCNNFRTVHNNGSTTYVSQKLC